MNLRRNCNNCTHIEYIPIDDVYGDSCYAFGCNGRNYRSELEQDRHLDKMQDAKYRFTSKKCSVVVVVDKKWIDEL